jgi:ribokinase
LIKQEAGIISISAAIRNADYLYISVKTYVFPDIISNFIITHPEYIRCLFIGFMDHYKITVIGSCNTDMVVKSKRLPAPGETLLGGKFFMNQGGKGANQAVAAARLGGNVCFIAKTGNDIFGRQTIKLLEDEGLSKDFIITDQENPSGVALIMVDEQAENCILVAPGANSNLSPDDLEIFRSEISNAEITLLQLEIPMYTVLWTAQLCFSLGKKVVLNPAPACEIPAELYSLLYLITPNETEAEMLTGIKVQDPDSAEEAAKRLRDRGVQNTIITLGSRGAFLYSDREKGLIPAPKVIAIDTTAAGDVFNGALCVALSEGSGLRKAVEIANMAASIAVTRMGAQASAPYRKELG